MAKHLDSLSHTQKVLPKAPEKARIAEQKAEPVSLSKEDSYESLFPEPSISISKPPVWFWWLLFILLAATFGVTAYSLANSNLDRWLNLGSPSPTPSPSLQPTPSSTPSPTSTPTATPSPSPSPLNIATISIRVLNGSGQVGAAAGVRTTLTQAGFTVRSIGNAKTQDYSGDTIFYQTGHLADAQAVQQSLKKASTSLVENNDLVAPDQVVVVVGQP